MVLGDVRRTSGSTTTFWIMVAPKENKSTMNVKEAGFIVEVVVDSSILELVEVDRHRVVSAPDLVRVHQETLILSCRVLVGHFWSHYEARDLRMLRGGMMETRRVRIYAHAVWRE